MVSYKGEKLIIPLNWSLFDKNFMNGNFINISDDIYPLFLAVTVESATYKDEYINSYNIEWLKKYEPIGCRDERTKDILIKHGLLKKKWFWEAIW